MLAINNKTKMKNNQLYCVKCKAAKKPGERSVKHVVLSNGRHAITAKCPTCKTKMYRFVSV